MFDKALYAAKKLKKTAPDPVPSVRVATLHLVAPDTDAPLLTLCVYDNGTVIGRYETMRCEVMPSVMQIGGAVMAQARTAEMVVKARPVFNKDDVKGLLLEFLKKMLKEIAEAAKLKWDCVEG